MEYGAAAAWAAKEVVVPVGIYAGKKVAGPFLDEVGNGLGKMVKDKFARQRFGDQYVSIQEDVQRVQDEERARLEIELESSIPSHGQIMIRMLHEAVRAQNQDRIVALLEQGVAVDCVVARHVTPLMIVSALGHTGIMDLLISRHANVNAQDDDRRTPLFYAASNNRVGAVRKLIDCLARVTRAGDGSLPSDHTQSRMIQKMLEYSEARFRDLARRHASGDLTGAASSQRQAHARPRDESQDSDDEDEAPLIQSRQPKHSDDGDLQTKRQKI